MANKSPHVLLTCALYCLMADRSREAQKEWWCISCTSWRGGQSSKGCTWANSEVQTYCWVMVKMVCQQISHQTPMQWMNQFIHKGGVLTKGCFTCLHFVQIMSVAKEFGLRWPHKRSPERKGGGFRDLVGPAFPKKSMELLAPTLCTHLGTNINRLEKGSHAVLSQSAVLLL